MIEALKPNEIKMIEKPSKKKTVWSIARRLSMAFCSLNSSTEMPVIYDKNPGYTGNVQGDRNESSPAANAKNKFTFDTKPSPPLRCNQC